MICIEVLLSYNRRFFDFRFYKPYLDFEYLLYVSLEKKLIKCILRYIYQIIRGSTRSFPIELECYFALLGPTIYHATHKQILAGDN